MKLAIYSWQDWRLIRSAIVWLGSALLLSGVMVLSTQIYLYFSQQEQLVLQQQLHQVRSNADAAQTAWQIVAAHQAQFNQLQQRTIFGGERRLDWIEALLAYAKQNPSAQLQYQFAPQTPLAQSAPINDLQIYSSKMQIHYQAANELNFSDFTQWLASLPGLAAPTSCLLQRAEQGGLTVNCDYAWLTIAPLKTEPAP